MATHSPAFQFYPSDFVGSGAVGQMTPEEVGVYTLLLCLDWNEGGFVYDEKRLARWCRMRASRFKTLWLNTLSRCFDEHESGRFTNHRLQAEREKQERYRVAMQENGRKGGRPPKKPRVSDSFSPEKPIESIPSPSPIPVEPTTPPSGGGTPAAPAPTTTVKPPKPPRASTAVIPEPTFRALHTAWTAAVGGVDPARFRKALNTVWPAVAEQQGAAAEAAMRESFVVFQEHREASTERERGFMGVERYAQDVHRYVRLGGMRHLDAFGCPTERGMLMLGDLVGDYRLAS